MSQKVQDAQASTYIPPSRLTMDSTEVFHSPNFTQHRSCTDGNVTPPIMNQNFVGQSIEESNL